MHGPINVKSPNNTSKWQTVLDSAFKGLNLHTLPAPAHRMVVNAFMGAVSQNAFRPGEFSVFEAFKIGPNFDMSLDDTA
jgi:hypothetical protein